MQQFSAWSWVCFILSVAMLSIGFYKMYVYESPLIEYWEYSEGEEELSEQQPGQNAYVMDDGYNYVINGNYAIAYFVLFGVFFISAWLIRGVELLERAYANKDISLK